MEKSKVKFCIVPNVAILRSLTSGSRRLSRKVTTFGTILIFAFCILNFLGCATYKFRRGKEPYNKGYVVARDDYTILEYSIGKNNTAPKLSLAKERFKCRRKIVEHYYKKMGLIENHFKMAVIDPGIFFLKMFGGVFRLPFVAISDYRYAHNPKYREKIRKREAERDAREETKIQKLKNELNVYIEKDLAKEPAIPEPVKVVEPVTKEEVPASEALVETKVEEKPAQELPVATLPEPEKEPTVEHKVEEAVEVKVEEVPMVEKKEEIVAPLPKEEPQPTLTKGSPVAVIMAKPLKGYSPLKVQFNGRRSHSPYGKIISYRWDFGDGDTSNKPNPTNTYWSVTYGSVKFTATLTVQDDKGNTATLSIDIEVITR